MWAPLPFDVQKLCRDESVLIPAVGLGNMAGLSPHAYEIRFPNYASGIKHLERVRYKYVQGF